MPEIVIRASSLGSYSECQLRAAAIALAGEFRRHGLHVPPRPAHVGALVGSGTHAGAELALTERMQGRDATPLDALEDAALEAYRERWLTDAGDLPVVMDTDTPSREHGARQIRKMVRAYRDGVALQAEPLAVESRIEAELEPGLVLSGQADLLALDTASGQPLLRDLKTARRRSPAWKHACQLGSYSLLIRSRGLTPDAAQIDLLRRVRDAVPQPEVEALPVPIDACERLATATLREFGNKARAFQADGDPSRFLANPASYLCSPRFCPLFGQPACPATRKVAA